MKYFGEAKRISRMNIMSNRKMIELFLPQSSYLKKLMKRFIMSDAKNIITLLIYTLSFKL